jgi:acetyl-CoA acetyltransferase
LLVEPAILRKDRMQDVYVVAVGMIQFGKYLDKRIKDLTAMVMKNLFYHSPVQQDQIEGPSGH